MSIIVTVLHVVACFVLIVVVLLQTGKGADIGAVFGGSSQTIFGSSGAGNLLTRLTTWTAVIFMVTSLFLTWSSTHHLTTSIADSLPDEPPPLSAPLEGDAAPAAPAEDGTAAPAADASAPAADATAPEAAAEAPAADTAPVEAAPAEAPKPADDKSAAADVPSGAGTEPAAPAAP
jgi:preprotein translocase subunit SecG